MGSQTFEEAFPASFRLAYRVAYRITGFATDSEDVAQEALTSVRPVAGCGRPSRCMGRHRGVSTGD
jgi:hypothetical protein